MRTSRVGVFACAAAAVGVLASAFPAQSMTVAAQVAADETGCDVDGDGYDDLMVGVPGEYWVGIDETGAVQVILGSGSGLAADGNQWLDQGTGMLGAPGAIDRFGSSLACGDFDGDGFDDLAIGVPKESFGAYAPGGRGGAVQVIYGSDAGLTATRNEWWDQASPGMQGDREIGDRFGWSLAAGDFDGDGIDDLAVGVSYEDIGPGGVDVGAVQVIHGSIAGLTADANQWWDQNVPGILGRNEEGDRFGWSLVAGDFNRDGFDDLAVGVPHENNSAGAVQVLYGSTAGLTTGGNQWFDQAKPDVLGAREEGERFGQALTVADFDGDGWEDLAIGTPRESIGGRLETGAVHVIFGSDEGLHAERSQWWDQNTPGLLSRVEAGFEQFGWSLAAGDFDGNGFDDLAIGVPEADNAGAVQVVYGSEVGLTAEANQRWDRDTPGIIGDREFDDRFGSSVAAHDFDGDGTDDLAIGVELWSQEGAGAVHVLYGTTVGLSAVGNQSWGQGSPGILGVPEYADQFGLVLAEG